MPAEEGAARGASRAVSQVSQRQVAEWPRAKWSNGLGAVTAAAGSLAHGVRQATTRATRAGPHCTPRHTSRPGEAGGRVGQGAGGGLAGAGSCGRAGPVVTTQPRHAGARSESPPRHSHTSCCGQDSRLITDTYLATLHLLASRVTTPLWAVSAALYQSVSRQLHAPLDPP